MARLVRQPVPAWVVATCPPRWLLLAKGLLAGLLVLGALLPQVGGFDDKGMAYRLPIFLAPALVVPGRWLRNRGTYPVALDAALTLPFLLDTAANGVGLYDRFTRTDDVLHFVNWVLLIGGVTAALAAIVVETETPRWLVGTAGAGIGAASTIGWEVAEYGVMRAGVGGLSLTYADTLTDLVLSTAGGAVGAVAAVRWVMPRR